MNITAALELYKIDTEWYKQIAEKEDDALPILAMVIDYNIVSNGSVDDMLDKWCDWCDVNQYEALANGVLPHGSDKVIEKYGASSSERCEYDWKEYLTMTFNDVNSITDFEGCFLPDWLTAAHESGKVNLVIEIALRLGCNINTLTYSYLDTVGNNEEVCKKLVALTDPVAIETYIRETHYPEEAVMMGLELYNKYRQ